MLPRWVTRNSALTKATILGSVLATVLGTTVGTTGVLAQENWSYAGANGPANWHTLSGANALCAVGQLQSPINIDDTEPAVMHRLRPDYNVSEINLAHNRLMITMDYEPGSYLRVGKKMLALNSVTFRTPAEHTIAGKSYPLSLQFIHRDTDGSRAIVVTLVDEGRTNRALAEFIANMPLEPDQRNRNAAILVNARDLMPSDKNYFRYMGSLTTPPCREGVSWYIFKQPIQASKAQIDLIKGVVGANNARPLQNRGNRLVLDARGQ